MTDQNTTAANEQEDLPLHAQPDGSLIVGDTPPARVEEGNDTADEQEDERLTGSDEEGHEGESEDEAEARRERNRQRRAETKSRRKEYIESLRRDLAARDRVIAEMNSRLAVVERKSTGSEMAQLERAEQEALQAYNHFKDINAKAIEQANGSIAIEAQERMFQARQRVEQIRGIRENMNVRQRAPQPLDPRLVNHAQQWMEKNSWYDPTGSNEDSAVALTIDNRMAQEGWDPTTPEYWEELSARVKKYLPHRASTVYNKSSAGKSAPPVAGSGRESSGSRQTYRLSPERVQAIKDAGMWDDPAKRNQMIKSFQQFDKEHANG